MRLVELLEALNKRQYKELMSKVGNFDFDRYKDIFDKFNHDARSYRIYLPADNVTIESNANAAIKSTIESVLSKLGFRVEDYSKNRAKKNDDSDNREFKISKILKRANEDDLANQYDNSLKVSGKFLVAISRHPHDIGSMSTGRSWDSCMNLSKGKYRKYVPIEIKNGTLVAYLIDKDDVKIKKPYARLLILPFWGEEKNEFIFQETDRVYSLSGNRIDGFKEVVSQWVNQVNDSFNLTSIVYKPNKSHYAMSSTGLSGGELNPNNRIKTRVPTNFMNSQQLVRYIKANTSYGELLRVIDNCDAKLITDDVLKALYGKYNPRVFLRAAQIEGVVISDNVWKFLAKEYNRFITLYEEMKGTPPEVNMLKIAISNHPEQIEVLEEIEGISSEMIKKLQMLAIKRFPASITYIKNPSEDLVKLAIDESAHLSTPWAFSSILQHFVTNNIQLTSEQIEKILKSNNLSHNFSVMYNTGLIDKNDDNLYEYVKMVARMGYLPDVTSTDIKYEGDQFVGILKNVPDYRMYDSVKVVYENGWVFSENAMREAITKDGSCIKIFGEEGNNFRDEAYQNVVDACLRDPDQLYNMLNRGMEFNDDDLKPILSKKPNNVSFIKHPSEDIQKFIIDINPKLWIRINDISPYMKNYSYKKIKEMGI